MSGKSHSSNGKRSAKDLTEADLAQTKMGDNSLQGNDQSNVRNQRHAVPDVKLETDGIIESLEKGKTNPACSQLQDFVDKVNDKISDGVLSLEEGQALIDAANNIRAAIGCNP